MKNKILKTLFLIIMVFSLSICSDVRATENAGGSDTNVGDKVTVFVGEVDAANERVSLILKDVDKEPWKVHADSIKSGDIIEGKVVKFMGFGAFVELFPGVEGLVHINEITDENIAKPSDVLEIGQKVKVKVLDIQDTTKKEAAKDLFEYVS